MQRAIRFIRDWHQFKTGAVTTTLDFGVMDALVNYRKTAVWHEEPEQAPEPKRTRSKKGDEQ